MGAKENAANDKRRKKQHAEVEHHTLARRNGIASLLQHRLCLNQVSLAGDCSAATYRPHAVLEQDA
jgi:hypothetical protein